MTDSLHYCVAMAAAAKPWFDKHANVACVDGLRMLVAIKQGRVFSKEEIFKQAEIVDNSSPDMDDADSALASVALSCCAGVASMLFEMAGQRDRNSAKNLFIDSIDLAVCLHDEAMEGASVDQLFNIQEVKESLSNIPKKITLGNLDDVLANCPAWGFWLEQ